MRLGILLLPVTIILVLGTGYGGDVEDRGYLAKPALTAAGVMCTNSFGSALYVVRNDTLHELAAGPGIGLYYTVSPAGDLVGCKEITESGLQSALLINLHNGQRQLLTGPEARVGQVSFATNGRIAFTVGTDLIVTDGVTQERYPLGTYANIAPVSPDARFAAFNDPDDQLWLLELATRNKRRITDGTVGFFSPLWSPDGNRIVYSTLHGMLSVYDLGTGQTYELGRGSHPAWTPDSRTIVFHRTSSDRDEVVASDLFSIGYDGSGETLLTAGMDDFAMDPSVTPDGKAVLFHTFTTREVRWKALENDAPVQKSADARRISGTALTIRARTPSTVPESVSGLDIPYVHQVYDTPDWFNGHWACAPTQAMMVLAYYHVLPPWNITCTWPSPHTTPWGNYVAEQYRFRGTDYASVAQDPNGVNGRGGYGFMWTGSFSPRSRMADYYRSHGLSAVQTEGTAYSAAAADISAGFPFSMCVLLTTSGHLVLAHGFGAEPHTLMFHDPYGNKNQGYMNASGKNVLYDWPGYNNGYQNLNEVAWCISTRFSPPPVENTVVDDLQFSNGFSMQTAPPASMKIWRDLNRGYQGHLWYAYTSLGPVDTFFAEWRPVLSDAGDYDVQAFIELSNATDARYEVTHAAGRDTVFLNQKLFSAEWVSLGVFPFTIGNSGAVRLSHLSSIAGQEIVFDAVRWIKAASTSTVSEKAGAGEPAFRLEQNYPNPFNPSTRLHFFVPREALVRLEIVNALGQSVAVLRDGIIGPGAHVHEWSPGRLSSGIYIARLRLTTSDGTSHQSVVKMLLTR